MGKVVAALHRMGFDEVFDTTFTADLTIMEESAEFLERVTTGTNLPLLTSCCPAWVKFVENEYPEFKANISTCRSPQQMFSAVLKDYYRDEHNAQGKKTVVVSIMPCTAKKFEKERPQNAAVEGLPDVDAVLTTRELARLIKRSGIQFKRLPEEAFDQDLLGEASGAGVIFGVTGGVMEAALRTAYKVLTGKEHEAIRFEAVRGFKGIKEASLELNGTMVNVAVAHGMKNARVLLEQIKAGESKYHFIEIMGCPGGCVNGGGQPYVRECFLPDEEPDIMDTYREKRAAALYSEDVRSVLRQSHNNTQIQQLYADYLGEPNSHRAHELLHTSYLSREPFPQ